MGSLLKSDTEDSVSGALNPNIGGLHNYLQYFGGFRIITIVQNIPPKTAFLFFLAPTLVDLTP